MYYTKKDEELNRHLILSKFKDKMFLFCEARL